MSSTSNARRRSSASFFRAKRDRASPSDAKAEPLSATSVAPEAPARAMYVAAPLRTRAEERALCTMCVVACAVLFATRARIFLPLPFVASILTRGEEGQTHTLHSTVARARARARSASAQQDWHGPDRTADTHGATTRQLKN